MVRAALERFAGGDFHTSLSASTQDTVQKGPRGRRPEGRVTQTREWCVYSVSPASASRAAASTGTSDCKQHHPDRQHFHAELLVVGVMICFLHSCLLMSIHTRQHNSFFALGHLRSTGHETTWAPTLGSGISSTSKGSARWHRRVRRPHHRTHETLRKCHPRHTVTMDEDITITPAGGGDTAHTPFSGLGIVRGPHKCAALPSVDRLWLSDWRALPRGARSPRNIVPFQQVSRYASIQSCCSCSWGHRTLCGCVQVRQQERV